MSTSQEKDKTREERLRDVICEHLAKCNPRLRDALRANRTGEKTINDICDNQKCTGLDQESCPYLPIIQRRREDIN